VLYLCEKKKLPPWLRPQMVAWTDRRPLAEGNLRSVEGFSAFPPSPKGLLPPVYVGVTQPRERDAKPNHCNAEGGKDGKEPILLLFLPRADWAVHFVAAAAVVGSF